MKKKYSKVYLVGGEKHFGYRYNYTDCALEYVSRWDCDFDENDDLIEIILDDWVVADSSGLDRENWNENPEYWIEVYKEELNAEARELAKYI